MRQWNLECMALWFGEAIAEVITAASAQAQPVFVFDAATSVEETRNAIQGFEFPVVAVNRNGAFAALLTRTDLIPPLASTLAHQVWAALSEPDRELLVQLSSLTTAGQLALVGGAVRDALLGLLPLDLDIVVVGEDVEALARATGLPFVFHPAYRNATLSLQGGRAVDLVSARLERYPLPGASPLPWPGTLGQDLRRRDFSLNALALVVGETGPELHDPLGGLTDLDARLLRPLHAHSFTDDASRLVRAARLAARLNLSAHPELTAQVPQALAVAVVTPRLDAELRLLLAEPKPGKVLRVLQGWGAGELLPAAALPLLDLLDALPERPAESVYAAALLAASERPDELTERLALGPRPAALLARALGSEYAAPDSLEAVLRSVLRPDAYVPLTGRDVLALGAAPGPGIGAVLAHLAALRQSGRLRSREDEQAALRAYLEQD
jgi:tRNA nucleotidyltransferase (CCA-adding enzyme)